MTRSPISESPNPNPDEDQRPDNFPPRSKVKPADTWDLASLFPDDDAWEKAFTEWEKRIAGYAAVSGQAGRERRDAGRVPEVRLRLRPRRRAAGHLRLPEDGRRHGQQHATSGCRAATSTRPAGRPRPPATSARRSWPFPAATMKQFLAADGAGALPAAAGAAAALQAAHARQEGREAAGHADRDGPGRRPGLPPAQRRRPEVRHDQERAGRADRAEPRHASARCCTRPSAAVRKAAFHQYYAQYDDHQHTLAATLAGSVQRDVYYARARNYPSALEAALFPDRVPVGGLRQPDRRGPPPPAGRCIATTTCGGGRCG